MRFLFKNIYTALVIFCVNTYITTPTDKAIQFYDEYLPQCTPVQYPRGDNDTQSNASDSSAKTIPENNELNRFTAVALPFAWPKAHIARNMIRHTGLRLPTDAANSSSFISKQSTEQSSEPQSPKDTICACGICKTQDQHHSKVTQTSAEPLASNVSSLNLSEDSDHSSIILSAQSENASPSSHVSCASPLVIPHRECLENRMYHDTPVSSTVSASISKMYGSALLCGSIASKHEGVSSNNTISEYNSSLASTVSINDISELHYVEAQGIQNQHHDIQKSDMQGTLQDEDMQFTPRFDKDSDIKNIQHILPKNIGAMIDRESIDRDAMSQLEDKLQIIEDKLQIIEDKLQIEDKCHFESTELSHIASSPSLITIATRSMKPRSELALFISARATCIPNASRFSASTSYPMKSTPIIHTPRTSLSLYERVYSQSPTKPFLSIPKRTINGHQYSFPCTPDKQTRRKLFDTPSAVARSCSAPNASISKSNRSTSAPNTPQSSDLQDRSDSRLRDVFMIPAVKNIANTHQKWIISHKQNMEALAWMDRNSKHRFMNPRKHLNPNIAPLRRCKVPHHCIIKARME